MTATTYTCSRCQGKGRISGFGHVMAGVCFKCGGAGTQARKPAAPSVRWAVFGIERATGELRRLYNKDAKTAKKAIASAIKTFGGASAEFREMFNLDNAIAVPAAEVDQRQAA